MKNAIILAAGKSNRFAPFTYEKPKGLFKVKGEILIERQIEQLKEAGIKDIYVVIGYMKEKFFYLEEKYGVKLIVNNTFSEKGNLYSLYVARKYLKDTYICCADQYFINNLFLEKNEYNISYRACAYKKDNNRKFMVNYSDAKVITEFKVDSNENMAMVGHAYFNENFSKKFQEFMEKEINDFGISSLFWEEFYARHIKELTLYMKQFDENEILEFDSIENLRQFDSEFLSNVDSNIINNICSIIKCKPNDIVNIRVIQAGLTNVSFSFCVNNIRYVYRHPGGTAGNLIDRQSEIFAQNKAKELGIDKSVIYIDSTGWKISYFVENMISCNFNKNVNQLKKGMEYLRKIHKVKINENIKNFDTLQEGKKLMKIACATKGNLFEEFQEIISEVEKIDKIVKSEAERLNIKRVLCHNDTYEPNYLATSDGDLYLIDWEYSGLNYFTNDIACIICRDYFTDEEVEKYLREFYNRELSYDEYKFTMASIALCAFYWFCWGLYKGSVGDDDGFFFLTAYKNCKKYIKITQDIYNIK